ncbi:phosphatase PAP2 family protein [Dechloromonas sp. HYN0024]|uniref:phosphatase PAP2 family protein n=1 Tax=Dechloromonas sp. HYN0024 TaxID=2231055 RepID=UPI001F086C35|nr:phosphatase PAP2 family protein [Dechloromonas sp. HYN0024]
MYLFSRPHWIRQLISRIAILWPLKAVGTMAFMAIFFWGYFWVLRNPVFATTVMPRIGLDAWIPFTPLAFSVYASLWVYVSLPPALLGNTRMLAVYSQWMAAMCLLCLGIFWLLPTGVPPAVIDWSLYPSIAFIKDTDAAGNACPSLHVASAVFSAFWLDRVFAAIGVPRLARWLSAAYCLAILWSTMATCQHVAIDVLAGTAVGVVFAVLSLRYAPAGQI